MGRLRKEIQREVIADSLFAKRMRAVWAILTLIRLLRPACTPGCLAKTYRGESLTSCCSKTVACPTLVAIIGCQPKTFCSQVDAGQDVVRPSDSV